MVKKLFVDADGNEGYKLNKLGHNLDDYAAAIFSIAETISRVRELESTNNFGYMSKVSFDKRPFDKERVPEEADMITLREEWHRALVDASATRLYRDLSKQQGDINK
jgi:hypothetical protein